MNADGSSQTNLSNNAANDGDGHWSADGSKVAFKTTRDGLGEIYVMNADGSSQTRLTNTSAGEGYASWGESFRHIGFTSVGTSVSRTTAIENKGSADLSVTNITSSDGQFTVNPTNFTVVAGGSQNVIVTFTPISAGTKYSTLTISSNDPDTPSVQLIVNGTSLAAKAQSVTTNEDAALQITTTSDPDGDALTYSVATNPTNGGLSGTAPNLTYTPNVDFNGSDSFTFTVNDGQLTSSAATVSITVNAVNDPPSFTKGADQTVDEDAGAQTVNSWATNFSPGPADESGQTLIFVVTNNNNALFSVQPSIDATGNLTYTPAANASGVATVTVQLKDNGGTANGGVDTSAEQTFTLTVTGVNDVPSFIKGSDQSVNEDAGAQTVSGWATAISAGSANESGQTLTFLVTNDNTGLFSTQPSIDASGNLTYTPAANASGVATVTVKLQDNGGTANGGVDTSVEQTFTVTVNPINDVPMADAQSVTTDEDVTKQITLTGSDVDGDALTFIIVDQPSKGQVSLEGAVATYLPNTDFHGADSFTFTVSDGQVTSGKAPVNTQVNPVNDPPTLGDLADLTINQDAGLQSISLTVGPGDGDYEADQSVVVTATSSNLSLIPHPTISGNTLTYTPVAGAHGSATITVIANDGQSVNGTITKTFTVIVPVCEPPTLADIASQTIDEDAGTQTVTIPLVGTGGCNENKIFTLTSTSSNPGLIPNPTIAYISPNSTGTLTYTPVVDANGTATITVTASDGVGTITKTFTVTVNPVNDLPTLEDIAARLTDEDKAITGIAFIVDEGGGSDEDAQNLTVTATSSDPTLVPNGNITVNYTADGAADATGGTLDITPTADLSGSATITVTVNDGQSVNNTVSKTFTLTVIAENDPPTLGDIADQSTNEDVTLTGIVFTVDEGDGASEDTQTLTVTATSSNSTLIPNGNITINYTADGAVDATGGTLDITPVSDQSGTTTITVTVQDDGTGTPTVTDTFVLTVNPVNDLPTLGDIADQSANEDTPLSGIAFTVDEGDGASEDTQTLTVTATSSNTTLIPNGNITVNYTADGAADATGGTLDITPVADQSGSATITVTVNDGQSVNNTISKTFTLTVNPVNDLPTLGDIADQSTNEDTPLSGIAFTVDEGDGASEDTQTLTVTATSSNTTLVPNGNITVNYTADGAADATSGTLDITPTADQSGSATITVTVNDGQSVNNTISKTFTLTVIAENDPPTLGDIADQSTNEDVSLTGIAFTVDEGDGASEDTQTLTVTATSSNTTLVPNGNITVNYTADGTADAAGGTFDITPVANQSGSATITVTVNDGQSVNNTVSKTFTLTVGSVNDDPVLANNQGLTVRERGTASITSDLLKVSDVDNSAAQLTYTIGTASARGDLKKNDTNLSANSTFTQDDIDNNRISYVHTGSGTTPDSFTFTVSDGAGGSIGSTSFAITITSVDRPIANPASVTTQEDSTLEITLTGSEPEGNPLTFALASQPTNGTVTLSGFTATYTPSADFNGSDSFDFTVSNDQFTSPPATISLTLQPVNDPPSFTKGSNQTTNEDAGLQTVNDWAINLSKGATNESSQTLTFVVSNSNNALFSTQPSIDASGNLSYTTAADANGSATMTVQLKDNGGTSSGGVDTSAEQTFTLTVNPINDAPTLADIGAQSTNEDTQLTGIAFTVDEGGGASEDAQTLTVTAISSNTTLIPNGNITISYAADGAADATGGTLDIIPAPDQSGTTTITVTVQDNGTGTLTATDTFILTVNAVNDVPVLATNKGLTVHEKETAIITNSLLQVTDVDNNAVQLTYTVVTAPTKGDLKKSGAKISAASPFTQDDVDNNRITYTHTGSGITGDSFIFTIADGSGGTIDNTVFQVTITPVDRPIADPITKTTLEDTKVQITLTGSDPDGKPLTFAIASQPSNGNPVTLNDSVATYEPNANFNGSDSFTFTVSNDLFTSSPATVSITVTAVNEAPSFTKGADQSVNEDAGAQTVSSWATNTSAGPANESDQTLTFVVSNNSNTSLFAVQPTIDASGNLTYTPATDANGSATMTVQLKDSGGTTNGGVDMSPSQSFTVTVNAVNDPPTIGDIVDQSTDEDQTLTGIVFTVDEGGGSDEDAQNLTVMTSSSNAALVPDGNITVHYTADNTADATGGTLDITPAANQSGTTTITVTVQDNGTGTLTATDTFILTVIDVSAKVRVNPSLLGFSQVIAGRDSVQSVTVTNTGNTTFSVTNTTVDGTGFSLDSSPTFIVAGNDSSPIQVKFTPPQAGTYAGTLRVIGDTTLTVLLQGVGIESGKPTVKIDTLHFGIVLIGSREESNFYLYNSGDTPIAISSINITNSVFLLETPLPTTSNPVAIAAQDSQLVVVSFSPTESKMGLQRGTISISTDGGNTSLTVAGFGSQIAFTILPELPADSLKFGEVNINQLTSKTISIRNTGNTPLLVSSLQITNPVFTISDTSAFEIEVGSIHPLLISFLPTTLDPQSGLLVLGGSLSHQIYLTGKAVIQPPKIAVFPSPLNFDQVWIDSAKTLSLHVENQGGDTLRVTNMVLAPSTSSHMFTIEGPSGSLIYKVAPAQVETVRVHFAPTREVAVQIPLTISSNDPETPEEPVSVIGEGIPPVVIPPRISPSPVIFDKVPIDQAAERTIRLTNGSGQTLDFEASIFSGDEVFRLPASTIPGNIDAHGVTTLSLNAVPLREGRQSGVLRVRYGIDGSLSEQLEVSLVVSGVSRPPRIAVLPAGRLQFVPTNVGGTGDPKAIWIRNVGGGVLSVSLSVVDEEDDFSLPGSNTLELAGGKDPAEVLIDFIPQAGGSREGRLELRSNDPVRPLVIIPLSGRGLGIELSPLSIHFGSVPVGTAVIDEVRVLNETTRQVNIEARTIGSEFSVAPILSSIAGSNTQVLEVTFTPDADGSRQGQLEVEVDGVTLTAELTGEGGQPRIEVNLTEITFGDVEVGRRSEPRLLTIENTGTASLRISDIYSNRLEFRPVSPVDLPHGLLVGEQLTLEVVGRSSKEGSLQGQLQILSNDPDRSQINIPLELIGIPRQRTEIYVSSMPGNILDFGQVDPGDTRSGEFVIRNEGNEPLKVDEILSSNGQVIVEPSSFELAGGEPQTVTVELTVMEQKPSSGVLQILSNATQPEIFRRWKYQLNEVSLILLTSELEFGPPGSDGRSRAPVALLNVGGATAEVDLFSDHAGSTFEPAFVEISAGGRGQATAFFSGPRPASGTISLLTNSPKEPVIELFWRARDVLTVELQQPQTDTGVDTKLDLALSFGKALRRRGRKAEINVHLFPPPRSGSLTRNMEIEGNVLTFPDIELEENTSYRLVVFDAEGISGTRLERPFIASFSTSQSIPTGRIAGRAFIKNEEEEIPWVGNAYLGDSEQRVVDQQILDEEGQFAFIGVKAGTYQVFVREQGTDRTLFWDVEGDGQPSLIALEEDRAIENIELIAVEEEVAPPLPEVVRLTSIRVDTTYSGDIVELTVYTEWIEDLTGFSIELLFDPGQVEVLDVVEQKDGEPNVLREANGLPLFLSRVLENGIEFGGSLLGATPETAPDAEGLLAHFTLKVLTSDVEIKLGKVVRRTLTGMDTIIPPGIIIDEIIIECDTDDLIGIGDINGDGTVNFDDFFLFSDHFGKDVTEENRRCDLDGNGTIDFGDFFIFADNFGKSCGPAAKLVAGRKEISTAVLQASLHKMDSQARLNLILDDGYLARGYGVVLQYNPQRLRYQQVESIGLSGLVMARETEPGTILLGHSWEAGIQTTPTGLLFEILDGEPRIEVIEAVVREEDGQIRQLLLPEVLRSVLPKRFALEPNYPNPFNPETIIGYQLPERTEVHLEIYNLLGQKVRKLVNEIQASGYYRIVWNGRNDTGAEVASGVYFYRLQAGNHNAIRKLVLLK